MKNIFRLVGKNLKLLMRSKSSALIVILGPLLVIFLAGMAFDNSNTYSISLGAYSSSYNSLSEGFINTLGENKFKVTKYPDEPSCVEAIKEGAIHSCIVFSPDFTVGEHMSNQMTFYVDYSKVNLVYMVLDTISETVEAKTSELSLNLTTVLLDAISTTKSEVTQKKSTIITLTTENDEASKKAEETEKKLEELELSSDFSATTDITSKKNAVSSHIFDLESLAEDAIDEAESLIDDIEEEVETSSMNSTEKGDILDILNNSADEIADIKEILESKTNLSSQRIQELTTAITQLESDMENAKEKLSKAEAAKSSSLTNLAAINDLLNSMLSNIAIIQGSMDGILGKLDSIKVTEASNIVNPVQTTIKPVVAESTHLNYIFPVLIVLVLMFTGILLSTTLIMLEKKTTAYFRNFISPTKDITFISATFFTCFLLLLFQAVVIVGISAIYFGSEIFYTLQKAAPVLVLCMTLFTLAGMLVGYIFNSEETATLGAISVGSIFLLLSDVILPLESMPQYIFDIAQFNPFVLGSSLLRKTIIHNVPFSAIENGIIYMLAYCASVFILVVVVQSFAKKHFISKYMRKIAAKPEPKKKANK